MIQRGKKREWYQNFLNLKRLTEQESALYIIEKKKTVILKLAKCIESNLNFVKRKYKNLVIYEVGTL